MDLTEILLNDVVRPRCCEIDKNPPVRERQNRSATLVASRSLGLNRSVLHSLLLR